MFLASGEDLRLNAAKFHQKIATFLNTFANKIALPAKQIRFRDHQHLTFDLFAKEKYQSESIAHKLRPIAIRYGSQGTVLPAEVTSLTYVVVNFELSPSVINTVQVDKQSSDPFNPLYTFLTDKFSESAKKYNLNNGALIANGLVPIVRWSLHEISANMGELQMLGYNPNKGSCGLISKWNPKELVENFQLVFVATSDNESKYGYGSFVNQIRAALNLFCEKLDLDPKADEVIVRIHQHIAYDT